MNVNIRSVIMIVVALGVAGFTAFLARGWLSSNAPRAPQIHAAAPAAPATEVLVAKMNIPTGDDVTKLRGAGHHACTGQSKVFPGPG